MVCFLIFLYRSFPFLFSLLVSASPVLVCTAVLLGTLLSFGELNIPEVEKEKEKEEEDDEEEEVTHEISSLKVDVIGDATVVVDKDENFFVESFVGKRKDTVEEAIEGENWEKIRVSKIEGDGSLGDYMPLINESSREINFEKQVIEAVEKQINDLDLDKKREFQEKEKQGIKGVLSNGEAFDSHYSLVQNLEKESLQEEDDNSAGEFSETEKGDHLDSELSSWKRANDDDEEEEEEDEEVSDYGSDGAESSSPDASMADIIPMLDELHPLLNEETPLLHEQSHKSKDGNAESDDDIENHADREEDGDDNDNEEEEEEAQGGKEDESKSAIKWTEDDQKNLMDLGTSELERNLRLESLIARRRARRNLRSVTEKNLIDLDATDLPINVPPILTTRRNPFDLPYDSYDNVPGSAPSVLLPRRNPFDLPYDPNEEKPDLKGDSFQQEFSAFQHREPFFRRHESFSVGPSVLGVPKQDRLDVRWKPYFVPERYATEETSYRSFQRQLSEASESKLSSVPDSESVNSAVEEEDKKLNEETEMISTLDHVSVLVERGSLSSEDVDSVDIEKRDVHHNGDEIILGNVEIRPELDSSLSTLGIPVELNTSEILLRMEPVEEEYSSGSSLSSLLEVDEKISNVKNASIDPEPRNGQIEESHIPTQTSLGSDFHFKSEVADENQQEEPVVELRDNGTAESGIVMPTTINASYHFTSGMEDDARCMEPTGNYAVDSSIPRQVSLSSDSHILSEVVDNDQQRNLVVEPTDNHIRESSIPMQTSVDSDFHLTSGVVDDDQHKEPVYDSSPQAAEKLLSLLSISSDTQGETSELESPRAVAEFAGKESEIHTESMGKVASGHKDVHEASLQEHSLDEKESRSREVTEVDYDSTKVGMSGDDLTFDYQNLKNGFIKPELVVEHDAVDSPPSSSTNGSIKDSVAYLEERSDHELDQLHSASSIAVGLQQDLIGKLDSPSSTNQVASEENILHALEKEHLSAVVDEHAVSTEGILQLDQVPSSSFDAEIHVNGSPDMRENLDSAHPSFENMPSNDSNLSTREERQPAVVAEQVLEAHLEVSSSEIKHVEERLLRKEETLQFNQYQVHSSSSNAMIGAVLLQDEDMKQLYSTDKDVVESSSNDDDKSKEPSVTLIESAEEVNIAKDVNMPESISVPPESLEYKSKIDEVGLKDNILDKIVYEDSNHVLEHHTYSVAEENISEEEDEIKEIDEGLLSELDTVGDFRVEQVVGESVHDEVRSVTDIELAFKQLHEEVDVEEVILPSMIEDQPVANGSKGLGETNLDLQIVEARSMEDTHVVMKQASEGKIQKMSKLYDLRGGPEEVNEVGSSSSPEELPILELRSINDIDMAFRQINEGVDVEEVILPSTIEQHLAVDGSTDPHQSSFDLPVVEARSLGDLHIAMKQASEWNMENMSNPSGAREGPVEANEVEDDQQPSSSDLQILEVSSLEGHHNIAMKQVPEFNTKELSESAPTEKTMVSHELKHEVDEKSGI
ncbi:hypothetical protein JCGZ_02637 [Jatropha curcas]|uniref:Far1-related sequence 3 n=2 Tax=Jatropha curcas TaxID=180498 RepID=A0A067KTY4_JATCU|nr:hypothetical protein JCGZ_02637 [Jatropha curcas]